MPAGPFEAVFLDFYGTLARATHWVSIDTVLADHGVDLPESVRTAWWNTGIDGIEHIEHSSSRDDYIAWQQSRLRGMLAETDLHPGEYEIVVEKLARAPETRVLEAYDEVPEVIARVRDRGLRLAICSNWDWDLDLAVDEVGLADAFDVVVSSAWAGARKPHPRIFEHTLAKVGVDPSAVLFVGDTWGPDVVGPLEQGMTPVYLRRDGHWPDDTAPSDLGDVITAPDLKNLLDINA
jgi:putative hydrolase of the HAD superfamily